MSRSGPLTGIIPPYSPEEEAIRVSRKSILFLATVVVVGSLLAAAVVSATQGGPPQVTEQGQEAEIDAQSIHVDAVIGDAPDENGYNGPAVSVNADAPTAPSETSTSAVLQELLAMPGPDQQGSPESVAASPEWTGFYYFFAAGSTFRPRDSSTGWDYQGAGCISARGNDLFTLHLEVPHGARIDYLRILYYDTNAANSSGYITIYDAQGGITDLIGVASTGNAGYGTALSAYLGHVVDTASSAYVLNWIPGTTGSTMRLCGLRVAYRLP